MSQYIYKCVQVPESITIGKKNSHAQVVSAYENIINDAAKDGWEYHGIDLIESSYTPGFLETLFCKIPVINGILNALNIIRCVEAMRFKVLVFKKLQ